MVLPTIRTSLRSVMQTAASLVLSLGFHVSAGWAQSAPAAHAPDRTHAEAVLKGLNRGRMVGQVAVSPDGKHLAWVQGGREGGEILVAALDDLKNTKRVTAAAKPEQHRSEE